jgi:ribulose-phosphate 3-epimerase
MLHISPSLLAADFSNLQSELKKIPNADSIHLDVMDGKFVPNISFGFPIIKSLKAKTKIPFDTHLMIERPGRYTKAFAELSESLSFHVEASRKPEIHLKEIRDLGVSPGLAVDLKTPVRKVFQYLPLVDFVLVMSVNAGFGGQSFHPSALLKISAVREEAEKQGLKIDISVDGGINLETGKQCAQSGANILIAGSTVFKANNPKKAIEELKACNAQK